MEIDVTVATIYFFVVCLGTVSMVFNLMDRIKPVFFIFVMVSIVLICLICFADLSDGTIFTLAVSAALADLILIPFCLIYYIQNKKLF